jgi:hypothetical protein
MKMIKDVAVMRLSTGRSILHRVACALVAAAVFAVAGASLGVAPAHAARSSESVLVDANADGDTPISRGLVRVYRCERPTSRRRAVVGAALRQSSGVRAERTNAAGAALLDFDRLPSCFIVRVSGGRANGRTVRGSFLARERNQSDLLMSVLVSPVSTLTYAVRRAHPGMSTARATRVVQRLLGIPSHFDDIDLAADDTPFDGDRYMAAASRAGRIGELNGTLIRTAQRNGRHTFRAKQARGADLAGDLESWWNETDVTKLVQDGLKDFGLSILAEGAKVGGKWALGRLLDEWGLKEAKDFLLPKPDTEKIIEMIQELTKRVNNLQSTADTILAQVLGVNYNVAIQPSLKLISGIKTQQGEMVNLLKLDPTKERVGATKDLLDGIRKLADDRDLLNTLLTPGVPGFDGILIAASKKAGVKRWFTPRNSESVRDVYKYYAIYQLRLANLLVEYWNTRSCASIPKPQDCLHADTIRPRLDNFQTAIDEQKALLKPPLPDGTFVDTKTMRMWPLASWPLNGLDALNWTSVWLPKSCKQSGVNRQTCTGSRLSPYPLPRRANLPLPALGPWSDWQFPSEDDYKGLIDGWKGDSPLAWLNENAGFRTTTKSAENDQKKLSGHMWLSDSFRPGGLGLNVYRANLSEPDEPGPQVWNERAYFPQGRCDGLTCTETVDFSDIRNNYTAQMLMWRPVEKGHYWVPLE